MNCASCGGANLDVARFCTTCGAGLRPQAPSAPASPAPPVPPPPSAPPPAAPPPPPAAPPPAAPPVPPPTTVMRSFASPTSIVEVMPVPPPIGGLEQPMVPGAQRENRPAGAKPKRMVMVLAALGAVGAVAAAALLLAGGGSNAHKSGATSSTTVATTTATANGAVTSVPTSPPASPSTSPQPAGTLPGWLTVGSTTMESGPDAGAFTLRGGDSATLNGVLLESSANACDYSVSAEGRILENGSVGWGLAAYGSSSDSRVNGHVVQYILGAGYRDVDAPSGQVALFNAPTDLGWHRLAVEIKGDMYTTSVDGQVVAQGTTSAPCGGVFLQMLSPGPVEVRNVVTAPPAVPYVPGHPCPTLRPNSTFPLVLCDQSDLVAQVQSSLASTGESVSADGQFGPGTQAALRDYQNRFGLAATGIVDFITAQSLGFFIGD